MRCPLSSNNFFPATPSRYLEPTLLADLLASYRGLSVSSPRSDVSKVLNDIISCAWPIDSPSLALTFPDLCAALSIDNTNRAALVTAILSDIKSCEPGGANGSLQHTG